MNLQIIIHIYKAEKLSDRLSVCHVDNSPETASFVSSGA